MNYWITQQDVTWQNWPLPLYCSVHWCNKTNPHYFINTCMNELQGLLPCDIHSGSHMLTFQRNLLPYQQGDGGSRSSDMSVYN